MTIDDVVREVTEKRQQIMAIVNSILDVEPQEPTLTCDSAKIKQYMQKLPGVLAGVKRVVYGMYVEDESLVLVNVEGIIASRSGLRRLGININPQWEAARVFAKEYAMHAHSYLHGGKVADQALKISTERWNDLLKKLRERQPTEKTLALRTFLPAGLIEAVGFAAKLKVGKILRHYDDYAQAHEEYRRNAVEMFKSAKSAATYLSLTGSQGAVFWGYVLGRKLASQSNEYLRDLVRLDLVKAEEKCLELR